MIPSINNVLHQNITCVFVTSCIPVPIEVPQIDTSIVVPIIRGREENLTFLWPRNLIPRNSRIIHNTFLAALLSDQIGKAHDVAQEAMQVMQIRQFYPYSIATTN